MGSYMYFLIRSDSKVSFEENEEVVGKYVKPRHITHHEFRMDKTGEYKINSITFK